MLSAILLPAVSWAQVVSPSPAVQVTVNSHSDGPIAADERLTLREAIALINGTLPSVELSPAEQQMVTPAQGQSVIRFDLPAGQTTIELTDVLPSLSRANTLVDGTSQPGYDPASSATAEIEIPIPVVAIRPADGVEVFRGLTIAADEVVVQGLSLYGFTSRSQITQSTPPADIFITHRSIALNRGTPIPFSREEQENPPTGVIIQNNWLGIPPDESMPTVPSSFGVSVFDASGALIRNNRIQYHNGSGVITSRQADNLEVSNNIIVSNGLSGMPDAIRMDGNVDNSLISGNLMCGNDGSSIFLFKPEGAVTIANNDIRSNGQRLRRAAIYVMGNGHRIIDNTISAQKGGGVVVTAFGQGSNTQSNQNVITDNRFSGNEGLSIDLNVRRNRAPQDFQRGDGPNPRRNSANRRRDTANSAVNAPQFVSSEFFIINDTAVIRGEADVNNEIQLYRSIGTGYGPLSEPVATQRVDENGEFEFVLDDVSGGEVFSAIATDPTYGTSEPARNTTVRSLDGTTQIPVEAAPAQMPQCTTAPAVPVPPESEPIPQIIQLEVPRNVHFGLDQDNISDASAQVLDRIAAVLREYPSIVVDLHGHTDSRASQTYNQELARRRAENARRYLLTQGIGAERMTIRSFGETQLLVDETNRTNLARNRRVEFVFQDVRGVEITFVNQEEDLQIEP
ncbi:MAG: OmpA family protein [Cyanobacteria bacterium J06607_10]